MLQPRTFLVVVDDPDRLLFLSTTLHRKFPNAVVQTCRDSEIAGQVAQSQRLDAIIACRSIDMDELPLVESLRRLTAVPIVLVSAAHHEKLAAEAGASAFLDHDRWLMIGNVVGDLIGANPRRIEAKIY
jgi:DNA-binding response OmpR family regulator